MAAKKKRVSVVKATTRTEDPAGHPATITETVTSTAPKKRCHLCPDGAEGKPLVKVVNAVRQEQYACQQHAAFYGRERTNSNRKYLPGNEALLGKEPATGNSDALNHEHPGDDEEERPRVRLRDKK